MRSSNVFGFAGRLAGPAAAACLVLGVTVLLPSPAHAAAARPVPYTFLANIVAAPKGPNTPPPGANDWSCVPSTAHPEPVVLVHGLLANETDNWQTYGPLLANNGYCVYSFTYGNMTSAPYPFNEFGGLAPMEDSALVLSAFVDRVLAATHAAKVDIVGHSEGATMPYWYLKFDGGAAKVAKMVGLAPVVHGTGAAATANAATVGAQLVAPHQVHAEADFLSTFCAACAEFDAGSSFIQQLDAGGITVPGVAYTQIVTKYDELVRPYTSGIIDEPNSTNFVLQDQCRLDFADHLAIVSEQVAARDVLNALDPAHPKPVPCTLVLPVVG